jgi:NAD-dependent dihydropyrimidine dehydrogenase PreA subunit
MGVMGGPFCPPSPVNSYLFRHFVMSFIKTIWGLFFRLFPCPTQVGLCRIGDPDRGSPVLVTCNFHLTVQRISRYLRRSHVDAWLLSADSKGVNVWCAAGGDEFNTHSVVAAIKTSGIADMVDHNRVILPALGAPGICAADVREQTGWKTKWGPVRYQDIPQYLEQGCVRSEPMKRVTYNLWERLDTALGSLFPFYALIGAGFLIFSRSLFPGYLIAAAASFVVFFALCPWIPGKRGITKALVLAGVLLIALGLCELFLFDHACPLRVELIIAAVMALIYGAELGGLASTMPSDFDPFLAKLGIGAVGNVSFAGTIRTELLNGYRTITLYRDTCIGCRSCREICPVGVWRMDEENKSALAYPEKCTACRACLTQCPTKAIRAEKVERE